MMTALGDANAAIPSQPFHPTAPLPFVPSFSLSSLSLDEPPSSMPVPDPLPAPVTSAPVTLTYKHLENGEPVFLDLYAPDVIATSEGEEVGVVVYFHGGGLCVGDRRSWLPVWLQRRLAAKGVAFISADYRLMAPTSCVEALEDVKDLIRYVGEELNGELERRERGLFENDGATWRDPPTLGTEEPTTHPATHTHLRISPSLISVAGTSAGGTLAYLAASHALPRPCRVLSLYGMGGDYLSAHYLVEKSVPFFRGREILDPEEFAEWIWPFPAANSTKGATINGGEKTPVISRSPLLFHPQTSKTPGLPANPRMYLVRLYLQLGTALDYITGQHGPSLSESLRSLLPLDEDLSPQEKSALLASHVPTHLHGIFPQLLFRSSSKPFPPTFMVHGTADTAVPISESRNIYSLVLSSPSLSSSSPSSSNSAKARLVQIRGAEHSFDYSPSAESQFGKPGSLFDEVVEFLVGGVLEEGVVTVE